MTNIDKLKTAGWVMDSKISQDETFCWFHPDKNFWVSKKFGAKIEDALRNTQRQEVLATGKEWFTHARARLGDFDYGYVVRLLKGVDRKESSLLLRTDDEKYAKLVCDKGNKDIKWPLDEKKLGLKPRPYLLIMRGKHGDFYFHVPSVEAFYLATKRIFQINKDNYYYTYLEEKVRALRIAPPSMTIEQAANQDKELKDFIEKRWKEYNAQIQYTESEKNERTLYDKCLAGDENSIASFVTSRGREHQYEKLSYESFDSLIYEEED